MKAGFPSMTAQSAAAHRAVHQLVDFPHVFDDPLAVEIVGPIDLAFMTEWSSAFLPGVRQMRAFITARSRYAEDQLARAIAAGTAQYVILGAGLDTLAYRRCYSGTELQVFEVDHPDTQAWKRRRLAEAAIPVPSNVSFVPFDFERQGLDIELQNAGLRSGEPVFFSLLGVTPYLANNVVMAIFASIHSLCPKSRVVFDYLMPRETLGAWERMGFDVLSEEVERRGEPFRGFFLPEALIAGLKRIGFERIERPTKDQLNAFYFRNRWDALLLEGNLHGLMRAN
jgi:methyltransferase (TIGR00027 family)